MTKKNTFENNLFELEAIIKKLESNELTLDESLEEYKNGIALIKKCNLIIDKAEQQVENLSKELKGND